MSGASITRWPWTKMPGARIEEGFIVDGFIEKELSFDDFVATLYYPGEHVKDLLNVVCNITDEQTALQFVRDWGMLGFMRNAADSERWTAWIEGALAYALSVDGVKPDAPDYDRIFNKTAISVARHLGLLPEEGFVNLALKRKSVSEAIRFLALKKESVSEVIRFAQRIRCLSETKRLLSLYQEDPHAAEYDAEKWINNLSTDKLYMILHNTSLDFLRKQHNRGYKIPFYQFALKMILHQACFFFSHRSERGVWIEVHTSDPHGHPEGLPAIQFDGLFRFIEYVLLVEEGPSPKRCADPTCGRIFFPTKADQSYCPPPPGVKRSRCENRHYQRLWRRGLKKPAKGGETIEKGKR